MKVSYRKINEFLDLQLTAMDAATVLTATGLEIEGVETVDDIQGGLRGLVVGAIIHCEQHPNADRLRCCKVDVGESEPLDIVCGAPNAATGLKVVVAKVGTELFPEDGDAFKIKKGKIRGEVSNGMLCGAEEVGIGEPNGGIIELNEKWRPGTALSEVFGVGSDSVLEIGLTPNRNDAMGHLGVARDLRAGLLHGTVQEFTQKGLREVTMLKSMNIDFEKGLSAGFKAEVEASVSELAPRYTLIEIEGITMGPSPDHAQRFLKSIGCSPINNVVDATNYVLHELGQPLHAFDADTIQGGLSVRLASKDEKITTLDGEKRELHESDLVIADANEAMCIAGIFGSEKHGVSNDTKRILLESAFFNPVSIRKSAKRHGLSTDASFRFEREVDPNLIQAAGERAAELICEWSGGKVVGAIELGETGISLGYQIELEWEMLDKLIGQTLDRTHVMSILKSLDIEVIGKSEGKLNLMVPAYRSDVTRPADVVEEILRIHGFDQINIPTRISSTLEIPTGPDREDILFGLSSTLVSRGFNEIMSNSLTKSSYAECVKDGDLDPSKTVEILNPLSGDLGVMRQSLLFQGLEAISRNRNYKSTDLRFFELGRTYQVHEKGQTQGYKETEHLSLWVTGRKVPVNWNSHDEHVDMFTLKEAVGALLEQVGVRSKVSEMVDEGGLLLEGNLIKIGNNVIGRFGQVHPDVTKTCNVDAPVFWADLLVKPLLKARKKRKLVAKDLPKFPSVKRDLSFILDKGVSFEVIKEVAFKAENKILSKVSLFDVYEGDKLEKGKVSYAIGLILQDPSKTLTDKQIDKSVARILEEITKATGATLR
jgi:phenylalanyl-tRNA synthetase beta chain